MKKFLPHLALLASVAIGTQAFSATAMTAPVQTLPNPASYAQSLVGIYKDGFGDQTGRSMKNNVGVLSNQQDAFALTGCEALVASISNRADILGALVQRNQFDATPPFKALVTMAGHVRDHILANPMLAPLLQKCYALVKAGILGKQADPNLLPTTNLTLEQIKANPYSKPFFDQILDSRTPGLGQLKAGVNPYQNQQPGMMGANGTCACPMQPRPPVAPVGGLSASLPQQQQIIQPQQQQWAPQPAAAAPTTPAPASAPASDEF